jgi:hypothetical protein
MRAFTPAALLVGILTPFTLAVPIVEKVLTPGGYRVKTNVHEIPVGGSLAHVGSEIHVLAADGAVVHVATAPPKKLKSTVSPRLEEGWITFAYWLNEGSPISSFTTTWDVPPVPETDNGQTVFLFNSIEPDSGDAILQPVLQVRASPGGYFF